MTCECRKHAPMPGCPRHSVLSEVTVRENLLHDRREIEGLTRGMAPDVAAPYFALIDREIAALDALLAERQQAIDALREIDAYIKDLAYPGPETNWIRDIVSAALLSLGEQP